MWERACDGLMTRSRYMQQMTLQSLSQQRFDRLGAPVEIDLRLQLNVAQESTYLLQ